MVASVAQRGYAATTVEDLVQLSGVARKSFYKLFADKEACFLAAVETILALSMAGRTSPEDGDWRERVGADMHNLALAVRSQPAAARLCLIETHAAGGKALEQLVRAIAALERFAQSVVDEGGDWKQLSPELIAFHAGAAQAIMRDRLYLGEEDELPDLMDELSELTLSCPAPPEPIRTSTKPPSFAPETIDAHDRSERALRAFTAEVAERGYGNTSVRHAIERASISPTTFYASFRDKEDVMLAAIDSAGAQLVAAILPTFRRGDDWVLSARAAFGAFFNFLASRPSLARLLLVEVYAAGPEAVSRREQALAPVLNLVADWQKHAPRLPPITPEALRGGVFGLAFKEIQRGGPGALTNLAAICTYLTLAPFIGAEEACAAANGDGLPRRAKERVQKVTEASLGSLANRVAVYLAGKLATAAQVAAEIDQPLERVETVISELEQGEWVEPTADPEGNPEGEPAYRWARMRMIDTPEWAKKSLREREGISSEVIGLIMGDLRAAREDERFDDRPDRYLVRVPLVLDEQGWDELEKINHAFVADTLDIQAKTIERLKQTGEPQFNARTILVVYEVPEDEPGS